MADNITYSDINSLGEVSFLAGSTFIMNFSLTNEEGVEIALTDNNLDSTNGIAWYLAPYGKPEIPILKITESSYINGYRNVIIKNTLTSKLKGKFMHQIYITLKDGTEYNSNQGVMLILPSSLEL